jgi:hypothetical protein
MIGITNASECIEAIKALSPEGLEALVTLKAIESFNAALYKAQQTYQNCDNLILTTYLRTTEKLSRSQFQKILQDKKGAYFGWEVDLTIDETLPGVVDYLSDEFDKSRTSDAYSQDFIDSVKYLCTKHDDKICEIIDEIGALNQESQTRLNPDIITAAKEIVHDLSDNYRKRLVERAFAASL